MKISEVIKRLSEIEQNHGDVGLNVYLYNSKETRSILGIHFDEKVKDVYIGIYG